MHQGLPKIVERTLECFRSMALVGCLRRRSQNFLSEARSYPTWSVSGLALTISTVNAGRAHESLDSAHHAQFETWSKHLRRVS